MSNFKKLNDNRGYTLIEIVVAVGLLGIVSVGAMYLFKMQGDISSETQIDNEIAALNTQILTSLVTPKSCNANFYNRPVTPLTGSPSVGARTGGQGIYSCSVANCKPGTAAEAPAILVNTANWNTTGINSQRVRIKSVTYIVSGVAIGGGISRGLTNLKLNVEIEANRAQGLRTITKSYSTAVIANNAIVLGCPRAPMSTEVY